MAVGRRSNSRFSVPAWALRRAKPRKLSFQPGNGLCGRLYRYHDDRPTRGGNLRGGLPAGTPVASAGLAATGANAAQAFDALIEQDRNGFHSLLQHTIHVVFGPHKQVKSARVSHISGEANAMREGS